MPHYFNINYQFSIPDIHKRIEAAINTDAPSYICVADGNILQKVHRDPEYRKVVDGALFSICDSSWVPLYIKKIYGVSYGQYSGSAIFDDITRSARYRQCFLGGSEDVLAALRDKLRAIDPSIAGMHFEALPFAKVEDFDYPAIAETVNREDPDIIWVSLGAPKQEIFMSKLKPYLNRGVMIGVGAVFNFRSGIAERRAPQWAVKSHLEFVWRLFSDPRKQWPRVRNIITALPSIIREEKRRARMCP